MASNTASIQQLLNAEKKAAEKVGEARKRKAKRLKQAQEEARAEIEAYRAKREAEFKDYESQHSDSKEGDQKKIYQETEDTIKKLNESIKSSKSQVVNKLISLVLEVNPQLPQNYSISK